jgi:hypothetical protein
MEVKKRDLGGHVSSDLLGGDNFLPDHIDNGIIDGKGLVQGIPFCQHVVVLIDPDDEKGIDEQDSNRDI